MSKPQFKATYSIGKAKAEKAVVKARGPDDLEEEGAEVVEERPVYKHTLSSSMVEAHNNPSAPPYYIVSKLALVNPTFRVVIG